MNSKSVYSPIEPRAEQLNGAAQSNITIPREFEIAGRRYANVARIAQIFQVSPRTVARWDAKRVGPPRSRIGKLVLFDLSKIPDWLADQETQAVHASSRRR